MQPVLEKDSVIFSADRGYACLFFLRNEYMTVPTSVYIANWERLVTKNWLPSYVSGRSFRRYISSDPGLLYVWSEKKMLNRETFSVTNCIGFYDYRNAAESVTAYSAYTQQMPENIVTQPVITPSSKTTVTTVYRSSPVTQSAAANAQSADGSAVSAEQAAVGQNTPSQTGKTGEPQKDYRYVQELLDKIAELEKSPDSLSMEEIARLRTEVDNAIEAMQEQ